uniref:Protein kinase domain-containing protein n=1 Tax=Varanus komodoensis TaxID=61221 RepID=A0A8D2L9N9_VARKO
NLVPIFKSTLYPGDRNTLNFISCIGVLCKPAQCHNDPPGSYICHHSSVGNFCISLFSSFMDQLVPMYIFFSPCLPPSLKIKLKEVIETPSEIVLILERVTGGELFDRIMEKGTYSEKDAVHVMKQILEAVSYLHANGVVHRDLKPENILFANLSPNAPLKIGDFGLAKILDKGQVMNTVCGTAGYCAPEVIQGASYGPEVDMWSLGVILYILLCGFEPFFDPRGDPYIFTHVLKCDYEFTSPWWDDISQSAKDLIGKLIVLDPKERLTIQEVLQHPWITGKETGTTFLRGTLQRLQEFNGRFKMKVTAARAGMGDITPSMVPCHGGHPFALAPPLCLWTHPFCLGPSHHHKMASNGILDWNLALGLEEMPLAAFFPSSAMCPDAGAPGPPPDYHPNFWKRGLSETPKRNRLPAQRPVHPARSLTVAQVERTLSHRVRPVAPTPRFRPVTCRQFAIVPQLL